MASNMIHAHEECQIEVTEMFEKLRDWRNECHRQFSDIMDSHQGSISKRVNGLVEEMCELKSELTIAKEEKIILLETADNLNREMRKMNEKSLNSNNSPRSSQIIGEGDGSHDVISVEIKSIIDDELRPLTNERAQADNLVLNHKDSSSILLNTLHSNDKLDNNKKAEDNTLKSDEIVCKECNHEFSTNEYLFIHIKSIHSEFDEKYEAAEDDKTEIKGNQSEHAIALEASTAVEHNLQNDCSKSLDCEPTSLLTGRASVETSSFRKEEKQKAKVICPTCGKLYHQNYVEEHKIFSGNKEREQFECPQCKRSFLAKSYMEGHINSCIGKTKSRICPK